MPIYLTENDSPNFRKISDIILPIGGVEGGQFASKKICKVYICTNTDPLEFKLVYNGCSDTCPCLCEWCLTPGLGSPLDPDDPEAAIAFCSYHKTQVIPTSSTFQNCICATGLDVCLYEDCYDEEGNLDPTWTFTPGCYYNSHQLVDPCGEGDLVVSTCFKKCCDNIITSCPVGDELLDGDNCCAYINTNQFASGKWVLNSNLYCNCFEQIPEGSGTSDTCP